MIRTLLTILVLTIGFAAFSANAQDLLGSNPLILLGSAAANAGANNDVAPTQQEAQTGGFFSRLPSIMAQIRSRSGEAVYRGLHDAGAQYAGALREPALALGGALALIYLFVEAIKSFGGKGEPLMNVLVDIALPAGFAAALIHEYPTHLSNLDSFLNTIRHVGADPMEGLFSFFESTLRMVGNALGQSITNFFRVQSLATLSGAILDLLATVLFSLFIFFIVISGLAEILAVLFLGPFLFAVGAAFGPLFIATLVTPWTRDYFGKWIGFMVASAMVTGVAGVAIGVASTVFTTMRFGDLQTDDPVAVTLAISAILLISVNGILGQVPSIASALVPGTLGVSSASGAFKKAAAGAAKRAVPASKNMGTMGKKGGMYAWGASQLLRQRMGINNASKPPSTPSVP